MTAVSNFNFVSSYQPGLGMSPGCHEYYLFQNPDGVRFDHYHYDSEVFCDGAYVSEDNDFFTHNVTLRSHDIGTCRIAKMDVEVNGGSRKYRHFLTLRPGPLTAQQQKKLAYYTHKFICNPIHSKFFWATGGIAEYGLGKLIGAFVNWNTNYFIEQNVSPQITFLEQNIREAQVEVNQVQHGERAVNQNQENLRVIVGNLGRALEENVPYERLRVALRENLMPAIEQVNLDVREHETELGELYQTVLNLVEELMQIINTQSPEIAIRELRNRLQRIREALNVPIN